MKKTDAIFLLLTGMLLFLVVSVQAHDFFEEGEQNPPSDIVVMDEMDLITLNGRSFNTQRDPLSLFNQAAPPAEGGTLQIVQFVGPIQDEWLAALQAAGSQPVHYVANNAYLVWADADAQAPLYALSEQDAFIQFNAPLPDALKVSPALAERGMMGEKTAVLPVIIQMVRHGGQAATEAVLADLMVTQSGAWQPIMNFQNRMGTLRAEDITAVAALPDVYWVGLQQPRQMTDEVQGQIMAGSIITTSSYSAIPTGPGYLDWLESYGFSQNPADYPLVDITDDGLGNGDAADAGGDITLRETGLAANPSRIGYIANCTNAPTGQGSGGHGHLNTSIAGGYDIRDGFPYRDDEGYQLGLGVNPFGRFGGTRVFNENNFWDTSACGDTDTNLIKQNQDSGVQISSNSWGCDSCAGEYDAASQAYDMGVRDADLTEPGNQQMVYLFSAGNGSNAATVGTPGNAKNVITVGASENYRPYAVDGCLKGPTQADDVMDIASFSSRGPAPGNRVKPDLVAPGTHVQGTAAPTLFFNGDNICGGINSSYFPDGQTIFTWSSGTSHAAPAVAGLASLYYHRLENSFHLVDPSPALIKAYLVAHPLYLTGYRANDALPSNSQGYGLPDMSLGLDETPRVLLDQAVILRGSGEQWPQTVSVADPTKPVRIVLAYTDQPGAVGSASQVNDLDLRLEAEGETYLGNHMAQQWSVPGGLPDRANNVEAVFLRAGTAGMMTITVTGFNIAGDGVPGNGDATDQDFALVCYNCVTRMSARLYLPVIFSE